MPILVSCILALLAGCGVFIAGMNMLSEGLEHSTGSGLKRLLAKISNRFTGVGIGAAVTMLIQSSSATSVMTIGFVNAGVMTLMQATAIIMGANIGTTITGIMLSFSALDISLYASALSFVGVMMMFVKKEKVKQIGGILCGFGLLFVGMDAMGAAFGNAEIKGFFAGIFAGIDFPLLLILCGAFFTALLQSSSAATGLIIVMVGQGALSVENALFIVLGSNIGTCVTAVLAAIGTAPNAKRTAFIHFTFNVIGTLLFPAFLWFSATPLSEPLARIFPSPEMQIAWFHVLFNVTTTLLLLPFIKQLVSLSELVIRDKSTDEADKRQLRFVDERLLKTPAVAQMQAKKEIEYMAALAQENLKKSFDELCTQTGKLSEEVYATEATIDFTNHALTKYLVRLASLVSEEDEKAIGSYFHVLNDLERIGDHAENFADIGVQMKNEGLRFSEMALNELRDMHREVSEMFDLAVQVFDSTDASLLQRISAMEDAMDAHKKRLSARHFERLSAGDCRIELSAYFFSTVSGLERVADHLVNVAYSIQNPTGSENDNT